MMPGQRRLSRSSVLVVGAGALGSAVALYLAACGVGNYISMDHQFILLDLMFHSLITN
jgi:adenylyltransferase/sulfurtransferase